jgi:spermidine/putrescine transport system permease protein
MVVEQLKELKQKNASYTLELNDKLQILHNQVFFRKSMTFKLDKKMSQDDLNHQNEIFLKRKVERLEMKTTQYEQRIINKHIYIEKIKNHIEEVKEKLFPSNPEEVSHSKGF